MNIQQYVDLRNSLEIDSVAVGYMEVKIFSPDDLEEAQTGYSRKESGESLVGTDDGDWKQSWLVVGYEDSMGEPIFVNLDDERLPVYTAIHGQGRWDAIQLATSFEGFVEALKEVDKFSTGRQSPVELHKNPIPQDEREELTGKIKSLTENTLDSFWESWLGPAPNKAS